MKKLMVAAALLAAASAQAGSVEDQVAVKTEGQYHTAVKADSNLGELCAYAHNAKVAWAQAGNVERTQHWYQVQHYTCSRQFNERLSDQSLSTNKDGLAVIRDGA